MQHPTAMQYAYFTLQRWREHVIGKRRVLIKKVMLMFRKSQDIDRYCIAYDPDATIFDLAYVAPEILTI